MRDTCGTCQRPLALIDFDGVAASFACPSCPVGPPVPTGTHSEVRRLRRTAGGTMPALSPKVYAEVRQSGPCVYCGSPATAVDHVWALARGGLDVRENLVPACKNCNQSKKARLLVEWDLVRVARAAAISLAVAAELERLRNDPLVVRRYPKAFH